MSENRDIPPNERYAFGEQMAFAHAIRPVLIDLDASFHKPIQGEASHKVIGWAARDALVQVGWMGPYGIVPGGLDNEPNDKWMPIYIVKDPHPNV